MARSFARVRVAVDIYLDSKATPDTEALRGARTDTVTPYRVSRVLSINSYRDELAIAASLREMAEEIEKGCHFITWEKRDE